MGSIVFAQALTTSAAIFLICGYISLKKLYLFESYLSKYA